MAQRATDDARQTRSDRRQGLPSQSRAHGSWASPIAPGPGQPNGAEHLTLQRPQLRNQPCTARRQRVAWRHLPVAGVWRLHAANHAISLTAQRQNEIAVTHIETALVGRRLLLLLHRLSSGVNGYPVGSGVGFSANC
eukprot:TRINITY_DN16065_c0_g1_i1.p1 TRINITY_DN16065_c0_g1~~TRINITY_DN16065_c0_g1_i1.p1  ORF type:complete len:137 (+),score=2.87 TRINITY_DN16065_c0_g1_i1:567-977(+)